MISVTKEGPRFAFGNLYKKIGEERLGIVELVTLIFLIFWDELANSLRTFSVLHNTKLENES